MSLQNFDVKSWVKFSLWRVLLMVHFSRNYTGGYRNMCTKSEQLRDTISAEIKKKQVSKSVFLKCCTCTGKENRLVKFGSRNAPTVLQRLNQLCNEASVNNFVPFC